MKVKQKSLKSKQEHWVATEIMQTSTGIIAYYQKKFPQGQSHLSVEYEQKKIQRAYAKKNKKTLCEQERKCVENLFLSSKKATDILEHQIKNFSNETVPAFKWGGGKCTEAQGSTVARFIFNAENITEKVAIAAAAALMDKMSDCVAAHTQMVDNEKASKNDVATISLIMGVFAVVVAGFWVGRVLCMRQQHDDIVEDYSESPTPLIELEPNLPRSRASSRASIK